MTRALLLQAPLRGAIARAGQGRRRVATVSTLLRAACLQHFDSVLGAAMRDGCWPAGSEGAATRAAVLSELAAYYAALLPGEDLGPAINLARDIQVECATEFYAEMIRHAMVGDASSEVWRATRDRLFAIVHGAALRVLLQLLESDA